MKKLFFLGACLVALASQPVRAQAAGPQILVVRVSDGAGLGTPGHLVIVRGQGQREEIDFPGGFTSKSLGFSAEILQQVFSKLYQEGYALKSTFSGGQGFTSTLVFVKDK